MSTPSWSKVPAATKKIVIRDLGVAANDAEYSASVAHDYDVAEFYRNIAEARRAAISTLSRGT